MNDIIKDVLEKHQVRKSRKQKRAFYALVKEYGESFGYTVTEEKASFGGRNIVIGNPDSAKVVYTAHYDTCAVLPVPNFITPKSFGLYLLYQLVLTGVICVIPAIISLIVCFIFPEAAVEGFVFLIGVYAILLLMIFGPANKHTANDNTSGVAVILETMAKLPETYRASCAFVLFDYEESGLLGSSSFASKHRKAMKNKPLINFDCVSDGKDILFAAGKKARRYNDLLSEAFPQNEVFTTHIGDKGVFYPSDQANFPIGIGVASLLKTKRGLLYMDKIHTSKDVVFEQENIEYLADGCVKLTAMMSTNN